MFTLTFLGTSASVPSAERNHPALLVEAGNQRILVDCGEGTQRQLLRSGAGFRRLDRLLLTHGHFDHVLGIPGLFSTLRLRQSADAMTIHGSPGTLDVVVRMLAGLWGEGRAPIPLQLAPLTAGQEAARRKERERRQRAVDKAQKIAGRRSPLGEREDRTGGRLATGAGLAAAGERRTVISARPRTADVGICRRQVSDGPICDISLSGHPI
jgi:ribonuclease BN (tRNA processing enzyme)